MIVILFGVVSVLRVVFILPTPDLGGELKNVADPPKVGLAITAKII